ncbi:hypothetical protein OC845_002149 [Tilletia horrida]|nr:hypothetical protein OC845_002149 [Tilletia horrida]
MVQSLLLPPPIRTSDLSPANDPASSQHKNAALTISPQHSLHLHHHHHHSLSRSPIDSSHPSSPSSSSVAPISRQDSQPHQQHQHRRHMHSSAYHPPYSPHSGAHPSNHGHKRAWSLSITSSARPYLRAGLDELYDIFSLDSLPSVTTQKSPPEPLLPTCSPIARSSPLHTPIELAPAPQSEIRPGQASSASAQRASPQLRQYHSISSATRLDSVHLSSAAGPGPALASRLDEAHRVSERLRNAIDRSGIADPHAFGLARSRSQNDRGARSSRSRAYTAAELDHSASSSSSADPRLSAAFRRDLSAVEQRSSPLSAASPDIGLRLESDRSGRVSATPQTAACASSETHAQARHQLTEDIESKKQGQPAKGWTRGTLALALTALSTALFSACAWGVSKDPYVANPSLVGFALAQPTCAILSVIALLGPAQRRLGRSIYAPVASFCARLMRVHVLIQSLVALIAIQNLAATAHAKVRQQRKQAGQLHVNAQEHAHDSNVGSAFAQVQFLALFAAQVALPVALVLLVQYKVARELGQFVLRGQPDQHSAVGVKTTQLAPTSSDLLPNLPIRQL